MSEFSIEYAQEVADDELDVEGIAARAQLLAACVRIAELERQNAAARQALTEVDAWWANPPWIFRRYWFIDRVDVLDLGITEIRNICRRALREMGDK